MLSVQYFKDPETGLWIGSDKPGYTDKQTFEEAAALYLWMPTQFPHGIRLIDRHGSVRAGIHTKDTFTLMLRHHGLWVPASQDTCSIDLPTAKKWLDTLNARFGPTNVLAAMDSYPVHTFTDAQLAARDKSWRVSA